MTKYICSCCGREFSRKKPLRELDTVWCKGCKVRKTHPEVLEQKRALMLERNPSKDPKVKKLIAAKAVARFADADQKRDILSKRKQTNIEKYGYASASQNEEVKQRNVRSQLERTGYVGWQNKELQKEAQKLAHSEEAEAKRHETCLEKYGVTHHFQNKEILDKQWASYQDRTGYDHPAHNPSVKHSIKGYEFEGIHFDSSWELAYYIWLRDNGKGFIYHPPFYLTYLDDEETQHQYQPDFLVEGRFVEIKGDHFFNEKGEPYNHYAKAFWWNKYNALLEHKVEILKFEEVKQYLRYVKEKYGKDYLRSFKRR